MIEIRPSAVAEAVKASRWHRVRLRYLGRLKGGAGFPDADQGVVGEEFPFFKVKHIEEADSDGCMRVSEHSVSRESAAQLGAFIFPAGTIVLAKVGAALLLNRFRYLGQPSCLDNNMMGLVLDQRVAALRFVLHSMSLIDLGRVANPGAVPSVNAEQVGDQSVPLPPLATQRAIADFLDRETARLDALVAAKERVLGLLAEKRRALITRAVTRGLDPRAPLRDSGIPWLGKIPAHWRLERAKFVFRQSALPVRDEDEIVTCFRDGQVTLRRHRREEGFTNANLELGYQGIRSGQLVLHSMDAFAGAIGVSDSDGKCSPEYIICDPQGPEVDSYYYGHLLRTMALAGFIQASCPAVRERAPRIRFSEFAEMFIPVPPLAEQISIVERTSLDLSRVDALRSANERTISLLKERRSALIAAAVTGQLELV